jgi:DNA-binding transcriptional LysR family regulator
MDTIDHINLRMLRLFQSVGQSGSFSDAGRQFDMPRAVVSRMIAQLESLLGVRLFQRTTRKVALTEEGETLLTQISSSLQDVRQSLLKAQAKTDAVGGVVTVSVSHAFGRFYVLPALVSFRDAYPDIGIEVRMAEGIDDVINSNVDLFIRMGILPDSSIVARRLGSVAVGLAMPSILHDSQASPLTLRDLETLPTIAFRIPGSGDLYRWLLEKDGEKIIVTPNHCVMTADSIEAVADLVARGYGLAPVPIYLVDEAIRSGAARIILKDYAMAGTQVHLCYGSRELMPRRVRLLADHILQIIGPQLL